MKQKLLYLFSLLFFVSFPLQAVELDEIAFEYRSDGTAVVARQNIATIAGDIDIPETVEYEGKTYTVTEIVDSAFFRAANLGDVNIPKSVTKIGYMAFFECRNLSNYTVASANTAYCAKDGVLFTKDMKLLINYPIAKSETSYEIPAGVETIDEYAFYFTIHLTDGVTLPASLKTISANAFNSSLIPAIELNDGVTTIGENAFNRCVYMTSISFSKTVENLDFPIFVLCNRLSEVTVAEDSPYLSAVDNVLFNKDKSALLFSPAAGGITSYEVPATVREIGEYAFYYNVSMTGITLPDGLETIGAHAFESCMWLPEISIPNSVTSLGEFAFRACSSLLKAELGHGISEIKTGVFYSCAKLAEVTLGVGTTSVTGNSFFYCNALTKVHCQAATPPACDENAFAATALNVAVLYVPTGSKDAYSASKGWQDFASIVEEYVDAIKAVDVVPAIKVSGNQLILTGVSGKRVMLYSVTGALLKSTVVTGDSSSMELPEKGIFLVKIGKQVRKIACL